MNSNSNNINLKLIGQNQQYQEMLLNQNYFIIDALLTSTVTDININSFPVNPTDSSVYIFGNNATNPSLNNQIAIFNSNLGWSLISPKIGMKFYVLSKKIQYIFSNQGQWIVFVDDYKNISNTPTATGDYKFSAQTVSHGNWLLCNGQAVSRSVYQSLFSVIGVSFGAGDGSKTFNVPTSFNRTQPSMFIGNLFIYAA